MSSETGSVAEYAAEFEALRAADGARLARFRDYIAETQETRATNLDADIGDLDYGRRVNAADSRRHRIAIPLGQATTVKHAYRISGRLPDAVVDRRAETPEERYRSDTMEKMWWGITRESEGEQEFAAAAWDSSKLGSAAFEPYWDFGKQMPLYRSIDPASLLIVRGDKNVHDFQRTYRFWTTPTITLRNDYRGKSFRGTPINVDRIQATQTEGGLDVTLVAERTDRNSRTCFACSGDGSWSVGLYETHHAYGFTPCVVIPNLGPAREIWGWSDYEFVRSLSRYIPILFGREADVLKATSNGAYIEKKTGQPLTVVQKILAKGGIIQSHRDGTVEPVQGPDIPAFAESHAEMAVQLFKMVGFAPDAAWGDGAAGSGSDRGLQLQPQIELTGLKQQNWGPGLSRLASMCFRMVEAKMPAGAQARYVGAAQRGSRRSPFNFLIGPSLDNARIPNPAFDPESLDPGADAAETLDVPRNPKELFDGDYAVRFLWHNRVNPDDPAYITAQLNVFAQGAQSLRTTLEKLGVENPEDEMLLIEQESNRFPWLRQGLVKMISDQLNASQQGDGGGNPDTGAPDAGAAFSMTGTKDGAALDKHAMVRGLGSSGVSFNGQ